MVFDWEGVFFKNDWKEFLLKNERGRGDLGLFY
jgi:hypothetical protein